MRRFVGWAMLLSGVLQSGCGATSASGRDAAVASQDAGLDAWVAGPCEDQSQPAPQLPATIVYSSCEPSPDAGTGGCVGDPGIGLTLDAGARVFPTGCRVTFPLLNKWFCIAVYCECNQGATSSGWFCPG